MSDSVGMAIKLTEANREKIMIVNHGEPPAIKDSTKEWYFLYPYNASFPIMIMEKDRFESEFRFVDAPNDDYFVDITWL